MRGFCFLFILFSLLFLNVSGFGQVSLGAKGGFNISTYLGKDVQGSNGVIGYHTGLYAKISDREVPLRYWQPAVLFSLKGSRYDDYVVDVTQKLYYIDVPFTYHFTNENGSGFLLGPQISAFLGAKNKINYMSGVQNPPTLQIFEANAYKMLDFALVGGFMFNIEEYILVEGRVCMGVFNFIDKEKLGKEMKGRIATIQLSVGINY